MIGMTRSSVDASPSTSVTSHARRQVELRRELARPDLRAAEVLQRRDRLLLVSRRLAQPREARAVLLVRAVGEVEAGDVHARVDEGLGGPRASRTRGPGCTRAWRVCGTDMSWRGRISYSQCLACRSRRDAIAERLPPRRACLLAGRRSRRAHGTPSYVYDLDGMAERGARRSTRRSRGRRTSSRTR